MRLDQRFRPVFVKACGGAAVALLFGFGMPLSAFGQVPQPPASAQNPPVTPPAGSPQTGTAPNPVRTLPPVHQSPVAGGMPISIDDAVKMALENNLGVQQERLSPQIQAYGVAEAQGAFVPALISQLSQSSNTAPPSDFLSQGGSSAAVTNTNFGTSAGIQQQLRWFGTSYQLSWQGTRATNDAPRTIYSPELGSNLRLSVTQPLLRNFRIDAYREQLLLSKNAEQTSNLQLQQQITQTSRNVRAAYYDLVGSIASLQVAQQSLDIARQSLADNQRRIEVGTIPAIDLVASQAEVASNEENVIVAQSRIETAEDQLRVLVMNPSQPGFWTTVFAPTEQPVVTARSIDVDAAIKNALANRTDLQQLKKQMESTDIGARFAADQKLPAVNVTANYGTVGVGGTQYIYDANAIAAGAAPRPTGSSNVPFSDVLRDVFGNNFRDWSVALNVSYPVGTSQADAAYAQAKLQHQQQQTGLSNLEMQVATQVRQAARQVNTGLKRVEATKNARELAEKRLEAEQKRFNVGLSTTFELFQAQRDLATAKVNELQATIDYNQAVVDFEAVQTSPIGG